MNIEQHKEQIIEKFEEIDYKNGLILIEHIINKNYNEDLIKNIIISLSKNKKKYTYEIYDYIIKNTIIKYDTFIDNIDYFLHLCALNGNIPLLKNLIKKDANINLQNGNGETALILASKNSNYTSSIETIKLLLDNNADINLQNNHNHLYMYQN